MADWGRNQQHHSYDMNSTRIFTHLEHELQRKLLHLYPLKKTMVHKISGKVR